MDSLMVAPKPGDVLDDGVPDDLHLVALSPAEVAPAQARLKGWCAQKVAAVERELRDFEDNLAIAVKHGWRTVTLKGAVQRTRGRLTYYRKIQAAVEAGFLIVPNFPIDVFAVRVRRTAPRHKAAMGAWHGGSINEAEPDLLPVGEGRYVDGTVFTEDTSYTERIPGKEDRLVRRHETTDFDPEIDFPVALVKPAVLDATARALALRIFDRLGVVGPASGRGKGDPIVIGQILAPRVGYGRKQVSFFVAWWLNTEDL